MRFDVPTEQIINQSASFVRIRCATNNGQRVGDEERPHASLLLIRIDDHHRFSRLLFDHRVVRVGQSERQITASHGNRHLLVPAEHLRVLFQAAKECFSLLGSPLSEQYARMGGGCPKQRLGDPHLTFPLRIDQVVDGLRALILRDAFRVDEQHAGSSGEPVPIPLGRAIVAGIRRSDW